jgi:glyoxylase-like metal-dependent hydrolase (beta-lactamase superfamily II)
MIESGDYPEFNKNFMTNFNRFMDDSDGLRIDKIFITHAHHDHFGGLYDVLANLQERGHEEPQVYKMLDGNKFEREVFDRFPSLQGKVFDLKHGDLFELGDTATLRALYTPGHATDHFSMLYLPKEVGLETFLFSGDIILGTPSTSVQDMSSYMETLYALRKESFEHICLPHALDNAPESIVVAGREKLEAYIKYREDRDAVIVKTLTDSVKKLSLD